MLVNITCFDWFVRYAPVLVALQSFDLVVAVEAVETLDGMFEGGHHVLQLHRDVLRFACEYTFGVFEGTNHQIHDCVYMRVFCPQDESKFNLQAFAPHAKATIHACIFRIFARCEELHTGELVLGLLKKIVARLVWFVLVPIE